jgi:signal transduction histidine kinase
MRARRQSFLKTSSNGSLALIYMAIATPVVFGLFGRTLGRREDQLRTSAKHIERLREEFAAVVAHDLRNPIQAILLQVQALLRGASDGAVQVPVSILRKLERGGERLGQMVNDLLDATRIEAARLCVLPEEISLPEAVKTLIERIRPTLGSHPVDIQVESAPPAVRVDPLRLDQILTNLVDNAAKYSEEGAPIAVQVRPANGGAEISVRDRGPGISPAELPRLFDRFYQAKRARLKKSGLGLGLYITKGLVEAHAGRIGVLTHPGCGSTFTVWLPSARLQ